MDDTIRNYDIISFQSETVYLVGNIDKECRIKRSNYMCEVSG